MQLHIPGPSVVVHGIGFGHADDGAVLNFLAAHQPQLNDLTGREFDEIASRGLPEFVVLEDKILQAQAGLFLIRDHSRRPVLEILYAAHLH